MSEFDKNVRKKKHFPIPRQEFTPRKTVILAKNDRDIRDVDKDKREKTTPIDKEKPPVIMIKVREPSAAKDAENRPQSPKRISEKEKDADPQPVQPVKIAQNENKEKKTPENKFLLSPTPMPFPAKLIDDYMEFLPTVSEYLQDTNTNFLVVGIIGGQSAGKSTIMNILAHGSDLSNICDEILKSHEVDVKDDVFNDNSENNVVVQQPVSNSVKLANQSTKSNDELKPTPMVFKCQDMEQIETGQSCTIGVDVYVTESRIILLDTGAVGGSGSARTMNGIGSNMTGKSGLEISAFLLAVCHVVVLVQDWFVDLNMLRFIQSAEMVKPSIPASSNVNQTSTHPSTGIGSSSQDTDSTKDHHAHLLFLQNKCTLDDFKPQSVKLMQDLYRKAFSKSKMHIESGMYLYDCDSNETSYQIDGMFHNLNIDKCGKPLNLFLMPSVSEDYDKDVYKGHPSLEELANRLRWTIFGVSRNQLTNVQLTEKNWLLYCSKTWDNIKKSTFLNEYNRLLP